MAINSSTYSGKQFEVYCAGDASVGTFEDDSNWTNAIRLDVEGVTLPTFNPAQ